MSNLLVLLIYSFSLGSVHYPEKLRKQFQFEPLIQASLSKTTRLKVAVLDNGFAGLDNEAEFLPPSTQLIEGVVNPQRPSVHGLGMAQIFWESTGRYPYIDLYLVNANGFSNFKNAIDFVIQNDIDIVLYSQVWGFGGNFNGTGLINSQVSRALNGKRIWINAAGDFGSRVYDEKLNIALNSQPQFLVHREAPLSILLSWNDFSESELEATQQDLDLEVINGSGEVVATSELRQNGEVVARGTRGQSAYAREKILFEKLPFGEYSLRVKKIAGSFRSDSRVRVLIESEVDVVTFLSATPDREIFPPADHPRVLTIGEDSQQSSRSMRGTPPNKPNLVLPVISIEMSHSKIPVRGSSVSAAIFAGMAALMKVLRPDMTSERILRFFRYRTPAVPHDSGFIEITSIPSQWKSWWRPEMRLAKSVSQYVVFVPYTPEERLPLNYPIARTQSGQAPILYTPFSLKEFLNFR